MVNDLHDLDERDELNEEEVRGYLLCAAEKHIDPYNNAINCTRLAEAVCRELECEHWLEDRTHFIWRLAYNAADVIRFDLELEPNVW